MSVIKKAIYNTLRGYTAKPISDNDKIFKDLSIYGDDFEELISSLSKKLKFDIYDFFDLFNKKGFYNPSEFYLKLPKMFYIDIGKLLKGKIAYRTIDSKGNDINLSMLETLIDELIRDKI